MRCERCAFFSDCEGFGNDLEVCSDYDESDEAMREEREAYEVDKGDAKDQTIDNKVGAFLNAQNKQQIVPNADKYALRKFANFGHVEPLAAAPAKDTVCGMFAKAREWFTDHLVPEDGRIAYVASDVYTMIAQSDEFIKLEKLGEKSVSRGEVGMLFGFHIIEIPRATCLPAATSCAWRRTRPVCPIRSRR